VKTLRRYDAPKKAASYYSLTIVATIPPRCLW
jgi:hypothetical protein